MPPVSSSSFRTVVYNLYAHAYADDLQVYGHVNPAQSPTLMARMADCITRIGAWTASNRLCLNPAKTEVIWLGFTRRVTQCTVDLLELHDASIQSSRLALSVTLESLSCERSSTAAWTTVTVFSLDCRLAAVQFARLQSVLRAAA